MFRSAQHDTWEGGGADGLLTVTTECNQAVMQPAHRKASRSDSFGEKFAENCPEYSCLFVIVSNPMRKITPFLWFDDQAEEAAKFYTSIFKNSKVGRIPRSSAKAAETTG